MKHTVEEQNILKKLASGVLDGMVGNPFESSGGKYQTKFIQNGIPIIKTECKSSRFFNGKENETIPGKIIREIFDTDNKKLLFVRKYGWLLDDKDVKIYSAKFKPQK